MYYQCIIFYIFKILLPYCMYLSAACTFFSYCFFRLNVGTCHPNHCHCCINSSLNDYITISPFILLLMGIVAISGLFFLLWLSFYFGFLLGWFLGFFYQLEIRATIKFLYMAPQAHMQELPFSKYIREEFLLRYVHYYIGGPRQQSKTRKKKSHKN